MIFLAAGCATALAVTLLIAHAVRQFSAYRTLEPENGPAPAFPSVAVIVPARNEADTIADCVAGVRAQDYPAERMRVVVVNDGSTDGTGRLARLAAVGDGRISVIDAGPLADGWTGKNHACWRGASAAGDAEWLCFLDADTVPQPLLLRSALTAAGRGTDLLSLHPRQVLGSIGERLMLPASMFALAFACDLRKSADAQSLSAAVNGQFMLMRSSVYREIGGHRAIREVIAEDSALAHRVKAAGYRIDVMNGASLISVRMYRDFRTLWNGLAKQSVAALGGVGKALLVCGAGLPLAWCIPAAPVVMAAELPGHVGFLNLIGLVLSALAALSAIGLHVSGARYFRLPFWYGLAFPIAYTAVAAVTADGLWRRWRGRVTWKGRKYVEPSTSR